MKTISVWLTHKDVSCWNITDEKIDILKQKLPDTEIIFCRNEEEFVSVLYKTEIAVIWIFKQEWFKKAPNIKIIITPAAGKDFFHVTPPENVHTEYSSFHGKIMAETVLAMMLCHSRGISYLMRNKTVWPRTAMDKLMRQIRGSRITILGFGNIGIEIAKLSKNLGANIYGVKRTKISPPAFLEENDKIILMDDFFKILPETDHLAIALPGTKESTDIINRQVFTLLPEHAVIYNVGRGNAVNEEDLIYALKTKEIAAAYLDVFKTEPLPEDSPLTDCPNCFIMPHASAISPNYLDLFIDEFIEKYQKWAIGEMPSKKTEKRDTNLKNECRWKTF